VLNLGEQTKVSRRKFLYAAGGVVAAAAIAGAGYYAYEATRPKGPITIHQTIHAVDVNGQFEKMRTQWNAAHPDIQLVQYKGSTTGGAVADYHRSQVEMAQSKSPELDIFNLDVIWVAEFGENGWALQLDDKFPKSDQADFIGPMIDAWTWKGHIYAVPWMTDIGGLWYRKDILDKEGITIPPEGWEWEKFFTICQDLKAKYPGMDGLAIDNSRSEQLLCNWQEFLASNGGDFFDESGLIRINDSVAVEALQTMIDMIQKYKICHAATLTGDLDVARALFVDQGKAIFHRNWNYVWGTSLSSTSAVKGKIWVASLPHHPGHASAHCNGGWSWSISDGTAHLAETWEIIKFLTSRDTMKAMMLGGGFTQARLSLVNDPDVAAVFPIFPAYVNLYKTGTIRPKMVQYMAVSDMEQPYIHGAVSGTMTAKDALDRFAADLSKFLGVGISTK
jgi:multiple sugar transport system substrate-binding protein